MSEEQLNYEYPYVVYQREIVAFPEKEKAVSALLVGQLSEKAGHDDFVKYVKAKPIVDMVREFPVNRGKIDILLSHEDGSISIIETKKGGSLRSVVAGIGQLSFYAIQLAGRHGVPIRRVLSWDCVDMRDEFLIVDACEVAGVIPYPLGKLQDHVTNAKDFLVKYGRGDGTQ